MNGVFQKENFDFGLLINQNVTEVSPDTHTLLLNFYLILTSQRNLYPKLLNTFGTTLGSFQTVRYGSSQSGSACSRKTSTVTIVSEKDKFESSGEESTSSFEMRFVSLVYNVFYYIFVCTDVIITDWGIKTGVH